MNIKPIATFSSNQKALIRNQGSDTILNIAHFGSFILFVFMIAIYAVLRLLNYKKEFSAKERFIFNTVDVFDNTLLFRMTSEKKGYLERISYHNIDKIVIRQVKKDDLLGTDLISVFEFYHRYGQKPLLRYDIIGCEHFKEILIQKGIKLVDATSVDESCIAK